MVSSEVGTLAVGRASVQIMARAVIVEPQGEGVPLILAGIVVVCSRPRNELRVTYARLIWFWLMATVRDSLSLSPTPRRICS